MGRRARLLDAIGEATLKYHAWSDGFDRARLVDHGDGFTVWYERDRAAVGVVTVNADQDYDRQLHPTGHTDSLKLRCLKTEL